MSGFRVKPVLRTGSAAIFDFDTWVERVVALRQRPAIGALIGLALYAAAFFMRANFGAVMEPYPFLAFFPAILVTAFLGGLWPAIGVAALSGATAWFYFMSPNTIWAARGSNTLGLVFFVIVSAFTIALIEGLYRVAFRLRAERERAAHLLASREAMFKELQHRVANNMQFISGLLTMQQKRLEGTPAAEALEQASSRLRAMSRIHRRLYDPASADKAFGPLIEDLCHELLDATGAQNIVCRVDIPPISLSFDHIVPLTLIVNEALTNAVKHAFPDGRKGTIRISLTHENEHLALSVADNGKGLPAGFDPATANSLGMRIFHALAGQVNGALSFADRHPGAELQLRFQA